MKLSQSGQTPPIFRRLFPAIASLLVMLSVSPAGAADKPAKLPLSLYCFDYAGDLKSVDVRTGETEVRSVTLSTANVIDAGKVLSENGVVTLHGPAAGGVEHPVVATLEVGAIREPLAVLAPAAEGDKGEAATYRSHVIDSDEKSFPIGSYRFVNLSPYPVRINFGDHSMEFAPATDKLFNPKVKAGELLSVSIDYQLKEDWLPVSSSRWAYRKDRRTLVCIYQSLQTQRMLLKSIPLRE